MFLRFLTSSAVIVCSVLHAFADEPLVNEVDTTRDQARYLAAPDKEDGFQFVIFGDRTGGPPEGIRVLEQAVRDTNLLDPDLVMTVGDLVNGFNRTEQWLEQMREFRGVMEKLDCEWYPVAGNHDVYWAPEDPIKPAGQHEPRYEEHFGPLWYSFRHKECGFVVLYTDEGDPLTGQKGSEGRMQRMSEEQLEFLRSTLSKMTELSHIFVFLHHPRWLADRYPGSNWDQVHSVLKSAGNVSAVFAGHIHQMRYDGVRDGIEYFTLAATGAVLPKDLPAQGFLHHFNVVTVRSNGVSIATVPVGTVIDPKRYTQEFLDDVQLAAGIRPVRTGEKVTMGLDGSADAIYSVRLTNAAKRPVTVTLTPDTDRDWSALPDHRHIVIESGASADTKFRFTRPPLDGLDGLSLPEIRSTVEYHGEHVRLPLGDGRTTVEMTLSEAPPTEAGKHTDGFMTLTTPAAALQIDPDSVRLPQGPMTVEAWVRMGDGILRGHGFVAMKQSEFALFFNGGMPQFIIRLDGKYHSAQSSVRLKSHEWTHVAGVYDGQEVRVYFDGRRVKAAPSTHGQRISGVLPMFAGSDPNEYEIPLGSFRGHIDELRLSDTDRYDGDFEPARRMEPDDHTALLYHLDSSYGPFVTDAVSNKATGRLIGGARVVNSTPAQP